MLETPRNYLGEEFKPQNFWGLSFSEHSRRESGWWLTCSHHPLPEAQATETGHRGLHLPAVQFPKCVLGKLPSIFVPWFFSGVK